MENSYSGPVDFLRAGGELVVSGIDVRLVKRQGRGGLWEWKGSFGPIGSMIDTLSVGLLRLPDGSVGEVIVNANIRSDSKGARMYGQLVGSGPAPF